jgi:hypothetical protein
MVAGKIAMEMKFFLEECLVAIKYSILEYIRLITM